MALVLKDRVQETSATTGTGSLTLAGALSGYQTFLSAIGNGNTTYYTIKDASGADWEVGIGTVSAGALSRDTVLSSSNSGSLVNFTSGALFVFCNYPAGKSAYQDLTETVVAPQLGASNGIVVNNQIVSTSYNIPSDYNAVSIGGITISGGAIVTIPTGSRWVVL